MIKNNYRAFVAAILTVLSFAAMNFAQTKTSPDFSNITIENFGQMDEHFYRGAQPKKAEFQQLKALGINTVIDLQEKPTKYEKLAVEALGMKYINIPMVAKKYPRAEHIEEFLKIANDPVATGKFYVHCAGGRHRTGAVGAAYRFTKYNWNFDQAYDEMKKFDFYTSWGHGDFKTFVVDYAAKMNSGEARSSSDQKKNEGNK
jgi:protein tyrosine/serine phosphatase